MSNPAKKKIPHVHGQRRSLRKMVGGVKSCLELNPIPSRDAHGAQTKPCVNQETLQTEPKLSLGVQFSSLAQSCPTLCNPMNCSTPGLPVHHQLPEFTQTHVHRVSDAIQPSVSSCHPLPLLPPIPPSIRVFSKRVNSSHQVAKVLEFQLQHQSFQ